MTPALLVTDAMPRFSMEAAIAFSVPHYFDGPKCKNGHQAGRYASDRSCVPCKLEKARGRPSDDKTRARGRAYYAANADKLKAKQRVRSATSKAAATKLAWQEANPGYFREWYNRDVAARRAYSQAYRDAYPDRAQETSERRRARKAGAEGTFSAADIVRIRADQKGRCALCRTGLRGRGQIDHIKPLFLGGSNWPKNLQLLCQRCNLAKGSKDPLVYSRKTGRLL